MSIKIKGNLVKKIVLMLLGIFLVSSVLTGCSSNSSSTTYPAKTIEIVVPYSPGGMSDLSARLLAKSIESELGKPVMVVNKAGGNGLIGGDYVAKSKVDGYTLGYFAGRQVYPEIYTKEHSYSSDDLVPVAQLILGVPALVVPQDSPWNTLEDFMNHLKENPGFKYAQTGKGATPHLTGALLAKTYDLELADITFKGDAEALTAVMGEQVSAGFVNFPSAANQYKAGNIKVLAVLSDKRLKELADVPTFEEAGFPLSLGILTFNGLVAPKGISDEVVEKLQTVIEKVANDPDFIAQLEKMGQYPSFAGKEFANLGKSYKETVGPLLEETGLLK